MSHLRTSTTLISRKPWQRFLKLGLQSQKQRRETVRCMKNKTEEKWSKVDCDTMLGTRQSFRQRYLQRKSLYFESAEEARIGSTKRKALEEAGLRKEKRHSPDPASVTFDKEGLLQEVNSMKEGEKVRINLNSCHNTSVVCQIDGLCKRGPKAPSPPFFFQRK